MSYRALGIICVRLLAIWMVAGAITFLPMVVAFWFLPAQLANQAHDSAAGSWLRFFYLIPIVDRLLIAFLLWVFAPWLGRRLIPDGDGDSSLSSASILTQGATAIAGLVLAITTVPILISRCITTPQYVSAVRGSPFVFTGWLSLAVVAILVLLGLGLIFGAGVLHNFIFRFRRTAT